MMTTTIEPRVLVDDLVFHWRWGGLLTVCGAPRAGPLMPHTQAVDSGLTECPACDRMLRASGWRVS